MRERKHQKVRGDVLRFAVVAAVSAKWVACVVAGLGARAAVWPEADVAKLSISNQLSSIDHHTAVIIHQSSGSRQQTAGSMHHAEGRLTKRKRSTE